jgi:predicted nucleic acid-binding protein
MDVLFLDTNVVLDFLGQRELFYEDAAKIVTLANLGKIEIVVSALSYSTIYYLLLKVDSHQSILEKLTKFKTIAKTSDLTDKEITLGLASNFIDFEEALQYYSALNMNCNKLITRNAKDFKKSVIPVYTPKEYLRSFV